MNWPKLFSIQQRGDQITSHLLPLSLRFSPRRQLAWYTQGIGRQDGLRGIAAALAVLGVKIHNALLGAIRHEGFDFGMVDAVHAHR